MAVPKTPGPDSFVAGRILLIPPYIPPPAESPLSVRID